MNLPPVSSTLPTPPVTPPLPDALRNAPSGPARSDLPRPNLPVTEPRPTDPSQDAPTREAVESAVKAVQEFVKPMSGNLEFTLDEESGRTVVKVTDSTTKELIRQIPSAEMLAIAKALDRLQGLLGRQKA